MGLRFRIHQQSTHLQIIRSFQCRARRPQRFRASHSLPHHQLGRAVVGGDYQSTKSFKSEEARFFGWKRKTSFQYQQWPQKIRTTSFHYRRLPSNDAKFTVAVWQSRWYWQSQRSTCTFSFFVAHSTKRWFYSKQRKQFSTG